jgi:hypothetical protein
MKTGGKCSSARILSFYGASLTIYPSSAGMRECGSRLTMGGNGDVSEGGMELFNGGGMTSSASLCLAELVHFCPSQI